MVTNKNELLWIRGNGSEWNWSDLIILIVADLKHTGHFILQIKPQWLIIESTVHGKHSMYNSIIEVNRTDHTWLWLNVIEQQNWMSLKEVELNWLSFIKRKWYWIWLNESEWYLMQFNESACDWWRWTHMNVTEWKCVWVTTHRLASFHFQCHMYRFNGCHWNVLWKALP